MWGQTQRSTLCKVTWHHLKLRRDKVNIIKQVKCCFVKKSCCAGWASLSLKSGSGFSPSQSSQCFLFSRYISKILENVLVSASLVISKRPRSRLRNNCCPQRHLGSLCSHRSSFVTDSMPTSASLSSSANILTGWTCEGETEENITLCSWNWPHPPAVAFRIGNIYAFWTFQGVQKCATSSFVEPLCDRWYNINLVTVSKRCFWCFTKQYFNFPLQACCLSSNFSSVTSLMRKASLNLVRWLDIWYSCWTFA